MAPLGDRRKSGGNERHRSVERRTARQTRAPERGHAKRAHASTGLCRHPPIPRLMPVPVLDRGDDIQRDAQSRGSGRPTLRAGLAGQVAPTCHHDRGDETQRDAQSRGSGRPTLRVGLAGQVAPTCHHDRGEDTQREARQTRTGTERCRRPRPANDACPNWRPMPVPIGARSQLAPDWRPTCLPVPIGAVPIGAVNCSDAASVAWGSRSG